LPGISYGHDMNTLDENWNLFCSKLEQAKPTSNGIIARCPAHDDVKPSLTASCNSEKILAKCQTGCSFESIVTAVGMNQSQFFAPSNHSKTTKMKEVCRYRYENKDGKHTVDIVRFEPKDFRPQRPDGKWTLEGVVRVPYRLPQILAGIKDSKDILILEGEKDCDNAAKIGLTATTFPGGTGKWLDEYLKFFQEAKVICIPDNDPPGQKGMHLIASKIVKVAKSVRWLELPDIPEKGDLSDWLSIEGNNLDKFKTLATETAVPWISDIVDQEQASSDNFNKRHELKSFNAKLLDELNQKYAIAPVGNKTLILEESEEEIRIDLQQTVPENSQNKSKHLLGGSLILNAGNIRVSIFFRFQKLLMEYLTCGKVLQLSL